MNKMKIAAAVIVLPLLLALIAQGANLQSKKKRRGHVKKVDTISIGKWGGMHIGMEVTGEGARLDFDCAQATISQPLKVGADGSFNVPGLYLAEHGGPVRSNENQTGKPAHFKGRVAGKTMTLSGHTPLNWEECLVSSSACKPPFDSSGRLLF
jgi:hypothetical protein